MAGPIQLRTGNNHVRCGCAIRDRFLRRERSIRRLAPKLNRSDRTVRATRRIESGRNKERRDTGIRIKRQFVRVAPKTAGRRQWIRLQYFEAAVRVGYSGNRLRVRGRAAVAVLGRVEHVLGSGWRRKQEVGTE